ncbi:ribonucleoside triphosphate reductase [archaeon]|jgi:ribonucleoside-triphosphate reductase (formate)|nr:ribonucleoside triphosphate reductase [archaeon]MBT3731382.1 ribonucleoside triphosphate reductase [archaeon]MBT4670315.1 ribonucleoside triphosphate reductase [archaeon]MBT5029667.1 ribonucleoside triphosphate reductase [archaeon]MBT5287584.1 ribonucleoside triphosphate reductase [archaeon]
MVTHVKKRDGSIILFNKERIAEAIFSAMKATGIGSKDKAQELAQKVARMVEEKNPYQIPSVEEIQDSIEEVLIKDNDHAAAKSFIIYRENRRRERESKKVLLDVEGTMKEYLDQIDWRVNENSNVGFSLGGLILYISGKITANYWLNNIYPAEIKNAHSNGDFHLHDLSMFSGYCAGWSLRQLLEEGFGGVYGKLQTKQPKHFDTVIGQMVNFLGTMQNEWAGAQALSSVDTYLAPYVRVDNMTYKEVKQQMQRLLFNIATPSRWGTQTPFINFTFDWTVPEDLAEEKVIIGGKRQENKYKDYQKEMDMINKAFMECMMEGDADGRIFTFPIPTYNITKDFDWDSDNANILFEMTSKYGIPYFQNFVNSELKPTDVRSMCCRLQLDVRELRSKTGGLFGSGENTGSIGVATINLPRLGFVSKDRDEFFRRLKILMDMAQNSLEIKRKVVTRYMEYGLLPYTKRYLENLDHHFSTIGLIGMNECCLNFLKKDMLDDEGRDFAIEILDFMRSRLKQYQEDSGHIYNLEATPGEGTSYRLARIDKMKYPNIITAGTEEPYYTNSSQLPVNATDDIFEALDSQEELQCKYTGGTVFHCFIGEKIDSIEACKKLVKRIAHTYRIPYYTITPTFSICPEHGYIAGEHHECPYEAVVSTKGGEQNE